MTEAEVLRGLAETIAAKAEEAARAKGVGEVERLVIEGDPAGEIVAIAGAEASMRSSWGAVASAIFKAFCMSHKAAQLAPCSCVIVR
jgi:nucleotide-binding universal stress UspA family protein